MGTGAEGGISSHSQRDTWDPDALMCTVCIERSIDSSLPPSLPSTSIPTLSLSPFPLSRSVGGGERRMGLALPQGLDDDLVRRQPLLAGPFNGVWEGTLRVRAIDPTKGCGRCILSRCKQHSGRRIMRCGRRPHRGLCSQRKRGVRMPGEEMDEVSQGEEIREDERQNQKERARKRASERGIERESE